MFPLSLFKSPEGPKKKRAGIRGHRWEGQDRSRGETHSELLKEHKQHNSSVRCLAASVGTQQVNETRIAADITPPPWLLFDTAMDLVGCRSEV